MVTERVKQLIAAERHSPPERVMTTPAVRRIAYPTGIRRAFCKVDPGATAAITCYLDLDAANAAAYQAEVSYSKYDIVSSLSVKYYSLKDNNIGHTPASSSAWWAVIQEVSVECEICGGTALNTAFPRLEIGKLIHVLYDVIDEAWRTLFPFQAADEDCEE